MADLEVPGYVDLEKIGSGGFAVVYRATQEAVGREVALKLLHSAIADEETERRFERECRVVGSLSWHPHIAAVLDAGTDNDGRSFLAFELLEGGSLGDRLKDEGPLAWEEAVVYAVQTADAIQAAHEQEVLHRDVKPDNILIDRLGQAKLADFGIAQMRDGNQTKSGVITATLAHAAPEVLNGKRASKLSDVYLLGSTLFELIAGEPPFGRAVGNDFFGAIQRIATEAPPFLSALDHVDCPRDVAEVVDRALRKEPTDRQSSAEAFGLALRECQRADGSDVTAMPFVGSREPDETLPATTAVVDVRETLVQPASVERAQPAAGAPSETSIAQSPKSEVIAGTVSSHQPVPERVPDGSSAVLSPSQPRPGPRSQQAPVSDSSGTGKGKLVGAVVAILAVVGAGGFFLINSGDTSTTPTSGIEPREVLQTESQQGLNGDLVIDKDLATGWLSPNSPRGHEIVIGFRVPVNLDRIIVHSGPGSVVDGPLADSRGLGRAVLEFDDGSRLEVELDEAAPTQTVEIDRQTTSLQIRSLADGSQPLAIREVEFVGQTVGS